jgi:hypothetical protein
MELMAHIIEYIQDKQQEWYPVPSIVDERLTLLIVQHHGVGFLPFVLLSFSFKVTRRWL